MKRLHIHVAVDQLSESIRFYSALFAAQPSVQHDDYAKWMLDDPRVNFAISQRGRAAGLDHLGIQADTAEELAELEQRMKQAELPHLAQPNSSCCYAESDKHWSMDPSGIAWETFHTRKRANHRYHQPIGQLLRTACFKRICPASQRQTDRQNHWLFMLLIGLTTTLTATLSATN